jgi:hypothetical protein
MSRRRFVFDAGLSVSDKSAARLVLSAWNAVDILHKKDY